jgi:hypothetical protein
MGLLIGHRWSNIDEDNVGIFDVLGQPVCGYDWSNWHVRLFPEDSDGTMRQRRRDRGFSSVYYHAHTANRRPRPPVARQFPA